jgi:hypothetical protein
MLMPRTLKSVKVDSTWPPRLPVLTALPIRYPKRTGRASRTGNDPVTTGWPFTSWWHRGVETLGQQVVAGSEVQDDHKGQ